MSEVQRLVFIQPVVTTYRVPLFEDLNERLDGNFSVYADIPPKDFGVQDCSGFHFVNVRWKKFGPFSMFSLRDFFEMWKNGSHFIHYADFKCLSLWFLLLMALFSNKKVFLHGQGGYKQKSVLATYIYKLSVRMSTGYIAYTEWCASELKKRLPDSLQCKVSYVNNSLYLNPVESPVSKSATDILFVGRLREGSNIEMLLQVATNLNLVVHVIGSGPELYEKKLREQFPEHYYYGAIYDWAEQVDISRQCFVGVYPGDAGLSVVTYLALGLPVVVHSDMDKHMGPEPGYITEKNGRVFTRNKPDSLQCSIESLKNSSELEAISLNSLHSYLTINCHDMAWEFLNVVG